MGLARLALRPEHDRPLRFAARHPLQSLPFSSKHPHEIFYDFLHRAMHHPRLFWMHRGHHVSVVTTPRTGPSMHPAEAVGWIVGMLGPCVLLSRLGLLGFWGCFAWLAITWSGNIAGHANAEMFPLRSSRLGTLFWNPISYHSLHHARFTGHYGFVTAFMDRLLGTEFGDWKELHDRVYEGQPLTSLREQGSCERCVGER
jgi:lathosterol oxidase